MSSVRFYRNSDRRGIEVKDIIHSTHAFPNHYHENVFALGLMEEGASYCIKKGDEKTRVCKNQTALINPGQVHSGIPIDGRPYSYRMVYIDAAMLIKYDLAGLCAKGFPRPIIGDRNIYRRLWKLSEALFSPELEFETLLMESLMPLRPDAESAVPGLMTGSAGSRAVDRGMEVLSSFLDQKMTLGDAADHAGVSKYHFIRMFKKATGLSPYMYRTQKRIDRAKQLILNGFPQSQAALETGFYDQSHFANTFKLYTGATPGQYVDFNGDELACTGS